MSGMYPGDNSHHGMGGRSPYKLVHDNLNEHDASGSGWYFSRKDIEENSPSRRDGIDLKKEAYLRKSYCTFLQDLGMRLKVPQVTIATAIIFCHRFFLRQSHAKNDRRTIATVCMFLAGKVEETPRPLKDVILVSYEIIHKKDPAAVQRIKQRDVYEQQKELILLGERVVLATLGFDLNVHHPYKPLVEAIKKFKVAQNALAQVAWNFVNDGLRTSLCLQFKPHHIAAGAIFLAAKFLKVKLPSDGEKVWWQEFDVTPRQLEEVSNQMLELYEQNRANPQSHGTETEASSVAEANLGTPAKNPASIEEAPTQNGYSLASGTPSLQHGSLASSAAHSAPDVSHVDKHNGSQRMGLKDSSVHGAKEPRNALGDLKVESGFKDRQHYEQGNVAESSNSRSQNASDHALEEPGMPSTGATVEGKEKNSSYNEVPKGYSPMNAIKIDKDKVKAALEKRRKSRGEVSRKMDSMDEDDLIERELESGIELNVERERTKQDRGPNWPRPLHRHESQKPDYGMENGNHLNKDMENVEEGELSLDPRGFHSPESGRRKRKAASPGRGFEGRDDFPHHPPPSKHRGGLDDSRAERDHRRHGQEYPV